MLNTLLLAAAVSSFTFQEVIVRQQTKLVAKEHGVELATIGFGGLSKKSSIAEAIMTKDGKYHVRFRECFRDINISDPRIMFILNEVIDHEIAHILVWESGLLYQDHGEPWREQFEKVSGYPREKKKGKSPCR